MQPLRLLHLTVRFFILIQCTVTVDAQLDAFALPHAQRYAPKPTVPSEYKSFFELDGHARELVDSLIGPRPGGFFPEKSFEVSRPKSADSSDSNTAASGLERALESLFTGSDGGGGQRYNLPAGFNQGFSVASVGNPVAAFSHSKKHESVSLDDELEGSGTEVQSSIRGIPKIFPDLAKPPIALQQPQLKRLIANKIPQLPKFQERPDIPEGGFAPTNLLNEFSSDGYPTSIPDKSEYGALTDESANSGGLIGTIINLIGLVAKNKKQSDATDLGKAVGNLIGSEDSPIPGKNVISNVLYKALTSGSLKENATGAPPLTLEELFNTSTPLTLSAAQQAAIGENLEMIQNLITQPSSPLCNPKPVPVDEFEIDPFMGQWYQVMYSPPLSSGPCSMVNYKKLADINDGGVGTIFEIFEYTTEGTPYVKPRISSGYAILKQPGELIYRTTSYQDDINGLYFNKSLFYSFSQFRSCNKFLPSSSAIAV
ncbi:hypothetical protein AB6A40_000390 [Gnathostoma spinigerum]|uniref:Uncharacterized protein n=1 Tax=Gnathostoma spinigerum TaxID=75299 RepID=A0ABD6E410_9BILA